jgi:magnesium-transporting ATPase (P-type)
LTRRNGNPQAITRDIRLELEQVIADMAKEALRTIALAHRFVKDVSGQETAEEVEQGLVLGGHYIWSNVQY